ncbi:mobilization protein [Pedobacter paludis]|uniref:Mobilization protein n=1 Tax=Pedobacter paludis TaxID=2203212 RepID=A0A317F8J9_9SPHI|nr:mobilization protein [Pedobacter paludis]PWS33906.1 mobilization protein [Pedobacter paludis]
MSRPKLSEKDQLRKLIRVRVNDRVYERLMSLQKQTDCRSICELARRILSKERITLLHKDISMNGVMEELALIRKELKAIGVNINQQTHYFHRSQRVAERAFFTKKTEGLYLEVDNRVTLLLKIVDQLAQKWLQK